jgi:hypothetical protein
MHHLAVFPALNPRVVAPGNFPPHESHVPLQGVPPICPATLGLATTKRANEEAMYPPLGIQIVLESTTPSSKGYSDGRKQPPSSVSEPAPALWCLIDTSGVVKYE